MTDFTGKLIANTYKDILTIAASVENSGIDSTLRRVQDGGGNNSPLKLSETDAAFTGSVSVNGNLTVNGSFQPDTVNTNELQATRISATSITTNTLNAGTLTFQDVSVSTLRAGTVSATNINGTNITVDGDRVVTSAVAVSAQAIFAAEIRTTIANTSAALQQQIDIVSVGLSATNTQTQINATQINTLSTSITANASAIAVNSAAITSINNVIATGAFASAGTSATLETRIAAVSSTMATSINNSNTAITNLSATLESRIATVSSTMAASIASTSAALESHINTVSATLSIANVSIAANSSQIAAVSVLTKTNKDAVTSINAILGDGTAYASAGTSATLQTKIAAVSSTMATSINNSNAAITSVNTRINSVSVLVETKASAATSANLETRINAVSVLTQTNKTSIAANASAIAVLQSSAYASAGTSATLESRIATVSSTMATSISNSNSAIATLSATIATSIANHLRLSGGTLTGALTLNADPSTNLQAATKAYVDNLTASSIHVHEAVRVETNTTNLNATYNNGSSGVGATLTNAGTQAALVVDDVTLSTSDRVLVTGQTNQTQNGVYVVTNTGSGSTNWILTRSDDADTSGDGSPDTLDEGSYFFVQEGTIGAAHSFVCNTQGTIVFGTTNITFAQFSDSVEYTAGTGINVNASRVISTSGVATTGQLTTLSATLATSIGNSNTNIAAVSVLTKTNKDAITSINAIAYASAGTSATLQTKINAVSATMATSIGNSNTNITTNANAITSINGVLGTGAFASAGTSATLQTKIATLSATMATSINNSNTNIAAVSVLTKTNKDAITSINGVLGDGSAYASAGTSATLQTKINTVSATMATSISNSNTAIATLSATMATSIGNSNSAIAALSATMATSISNHLPLAGGTVTGTITASAVVAPTPINTQTGTTYTTSIGDASRLVTLNNGSAITVTIPPNSSVAYSVGTKIDFAQIGAGQVTFAGGAGVSIGATPTLKLRDQHSASTCIKLATDTWLLVGDLAES